MNISEIFKKSIGSDTEGGPRVYVTCTTHGCPDEITERLRKETEEYWEKVKGIIKKTWFTCPKCENVICLKEELENLEDDYCTHCGSEIASAKKKALAKTEG